MSDLEDQGSGTVLTSIDFAKGFDRVGHKHCLSAFAAHGSSTPILAILGIFLQGRSMSVRVNSTYSDPMPLNGGCPQGSLLGVIIFNVSVDTIEDTPSIFPEDETIRIGPAYDTRDRDFLRAHESVSGSMTYLNPDSSLLPSISVSSSASPNHDTIDHSSPGPFCSTPLGLSAPALDCFDSPINLSPSSPCSASSDPSYSLLPGVRNPPR